MCDYCMRTGDIRTKVDILIGHSTLSRGEFKRAIQLPDMFCLSLPNEGASPCTAMIVVQRQGKTNQYGKSQYNGVIRHKDPNMCSIGAVAMYFFKRFHIDRKLLYYSCVT